MEDPDRSEKTLLAPNEASLRFNIPLRTIYFWHRTGNIKGVHLNGKRLRIFSASIQEFLRLRCEVSSGGGSAGRRGKPGRVAGLPARQAGQAVQRYEREGNGTPGSDGSGHKGDKEIALVASPEEIGMLKTLMKRAGSPGYHDWAGLDTRSEQ